MPADIVSNRTITKADLVERVYENIGFSKKEAAQIVDSVFEVMKSALEHGDKVKISGFGNFVVQKKLPRRGRNPQTNTPLVIDARRVLTFKASPVLKMALNESRIDV